MKRKLYTVLFIIMIAMIIKPLLCVNAASSLRLSKEKVTLESDATIKLSLSNIKATDIKWWSADKSIASVNKNGIISAKDEGTVIIYAKYNKKTYKCNVNVIDSSKIPDSITPGIWIVGEDIPEGKYLLSSLKGVGTLKLYDNYDAYKKCKSEYSSDLVLAYESLAGLSGANEIYQDVFSGYGSDYYANLKAGQCLEITGVTLSVTVK